MPARFERVAAGDHLALLVDEPDGLDVLEQRHALHDASDAIVGIGFEKGLDGELEVVGEVVGLGEFSLTHRLRVAELVLQSHELASGDGEEHAEDGEGRQAPATRLGIEPRTHHSLSPTRD